MLTGKGKYFITHNPTLFAEAFAIGMNDGSGTQAIMLQLYF